MFYDNIIIYHDTWFIRNNCIQDSSIMLIIIANNITMN